MSRCRDCHSHQVAGRPENLPAVDQSKAGNYLFNWLVAKDPEPIQKMERPLVGEKKDAGNSHP